MLSYVIDRLNLTPKGILDNKTHLDLVTKGILELLGCHFSLKPALKHGDLLAKELFDNAIYGYNAAKHVGFKVIRTVTHTVFSGHCILKTIDMKAQVSLNDTKVLGYYHIEPTAGIHEVTQGKFLLPPRNVLYHTRKILNRFTTPLFWA